MSTLIECRAEEAHEHRELVDAVSDGRSLGCIVRGLLAHDDIATALARLSIAQPTAPVHIIAPGAVSLGVMLAPTMEQPRGPAFDAYLRAAGKWSAATLLERAALDRFERVLSDLCASRPVAYPVAPDGRRYARATVRVFHEGSGAPGHCDTYAELPCRQHLEGLIDGRTQLSWYIALSMPERGGELTLLDLRHGETGTVDAAAVHARYRLDPGDLVLFDGGRWFHRIEAIYGPTPRRTVGGFCALERGGRCLYVWG